jgi:hypothetical protein
MSTNLNQVGISECEIALTRISDAPTANNLSFEN